MPVPFEGSQAESPSVEQANEFAECALGLIHNLALDVNGEHAGHSAYQVDDDTLIEIDVCEFRMTSPGRPDIVATFMEFDTNEDDRYTQTDITLWESVDASLQRCTPVPYEAVGYEVMVGEEDHRIAVRGLSLQNKVRRNKAIPKVERKILEKLVDPKFTLADFLKFRSLLARCNETNRINED